jgi:integrase
VQLAQANYDTEKLRLAALEKGAKAAAPKVTVLSPPSVPAHPDRPDYWRDALIALFGCVALGIAGVWFVEFFQRSDAPRPEPAVQQPIIHISYPPPGVAFEAPVAVLGGSAQRLPETISHFPRELSGSEVRALWAAALPDAHLVIAGLLGGFTLEEFAGLRYGHIDAETGSAHVPGVSARALTLRDPLMRLLIERRSGNRGDAPLADAQGRPFSTDDLEGLIACAACDAGLAHFDEVDSEALRHTYFAYLIRQGARLADIGEFIGHIPPAAFREYGRLSPPGPGLPIEQVDPVFPGLRLPG